MGIVSPWRENERILLYGPAGCGKSSCALNVARAIDGQMFVVDNDRSWGRMLDGKPDDLVDRIHVADIRKEAFKADVQPWAPLLANTRKMAREAGKGDWLVVDMATPVWAWAQSAFAVEVFGKDIADYFVQARKTQVENNKRGGNAFDGLQDWPAISRMYDEFNDAILNTDAHLMLIAEMSPLLGDVAAEVENVYQTLGGRPKGNKTLDYIASTVLKLDQNIKGEYVMSTAKDRERDKINRKPWDDFAKNYLMAISGWNLPAVLAAKAKAKVVEA